MEAKELRIGNWIINEFGYEDFNNGICQITGIFHDLIGFKGYAIQTGKGHSTLLKDDDNECYFKPIPLTEEWLVRFGLKEKPNYTAFHKSHVELNILGLGLSF